MSLMSLNRKLVSGEVRKLLFGAVKRGREKIMASRVEVLFIDEGDSVNKGNGFILNFFFRLGARFHNGFPERYANFYSVLEQLMI